MISGTMQKLPAAEVIRKKNNRQQLFRVISLAGCKATLWTVTCLLDVPVHVQIRALDHPKDDLNYQMAYRPSTNLNISKRVMNSGFG